MKKPEERTVEKFVDKSRQIKARLRLREAVAIPPVSSTDIKLASDVVNTP